MALIKMFYEAVLEERGARVWPPRTTPLQERQFRAEISFRMNIYFSRNISIIIIIIITKLLWRQYPRKESSSVGHLLQGLGKLIVQIQCKVHQQ